jgi:hypothetical protein
MKKIIIILILLASSNLMRAQYKIHSSTFGNGAVVTSGSYKLYGSTNQTHIGSSNNLSVTMKIGFWNTFLFKALALPSISTNSISLLNCDRATSGGLITYDGGVNITARGIVWNTSGSPTILSYTGKSTNGSGLGSYSYQMTGLSANTTYYVRAYATNGVGTSYGNEVSFSTMAAPSVDSASISLNTDQNGNYWDDNNSYNSNASVPTNGQVPDDGDGSDSNFDDNPTWTFDGTNDCFQIPYNNNNRRLNNNSAKSLFIYFRTGSTVSTRQVLLELGGTTSGFNAYIYSGKVWVGMWNSTQRRFFSTSIAIGTNYLVSVEFNGTKVRTSLNGYCSSSMLFSGFATNSNTNGIGASINGTRYMDNTSGTGLSSFLNGTVAEILLYNSCDMDLRESIVDFIDSKYNKNYSSNYTPYFGKESLNLSWENFESDVSPFDNNEEVINSNLEVYKSQKDLVINLNLDETENIELAIFDLSGKKVAIIENAEFKKGINNFTYSTESLISGVYIVRAIGLIVNESVKINIVK